MPASALPPDFLAATGEHMVRCEAAVHGWVPFLCDGGILAGEVVFSGDDLFAGADWAAAALGAA